jgi:K+-transporting ATPase ATPase A chain
MLLGRFGVIIPILVIAGSMAGKNRTAENEGTFHADNPLFAIVLLLSILIVIALTFVPVLLLGPVVEHLLLLNSTHF